jgi:hypothetical protein
MVVGNLSEQTSRAHFSIEDIGAELAINAGAGFFVSLPETPK